MRGRRPKSAEGSAARIVRNSLATGAGTFSGVLITLFLTPLLIDRLGADGYGVWVLATSLTFSLGYLSFAELGIESSAVRFIAEARGRQDAEDANRIFSTSLVLFAALAVVLTPLLVLLAGPIAGLFSIPQELHDEARLTFAIVAAQLGLDLPSRAFSAVLQGTQRYGLWQAVELTQVSVTAVVFAAVVLLGGGIVGLATASVAIAGAMLIANVAAARIAAPAMHVSPRLVSREVVRRIAGYGGKLILFRVGGLVYRQTDKTIIGLILTASLVTTYEIAFKIQAAAAMVETMAASALIPAVAFSRDRLDRLREILLRGTAYAMAMAMPFVVAAFVFADPLIRTWIGDGFGESVGPTRLFLAVLVFTSMVTVGQSMLTGLGRLREMLILLAVSIALNLGLTVWWAQTMGVEGVVLATLVSIALTSIPLVFVVLRELETAGRAFLQRVILPLVPAMAVQAVVSVALLGPARETDSLVLVGLLAVPGIVAFALVYTFVGLRPADRRRLVDTLRAALGRERPAPSPAGGLRDEVPGGDTPSPSGTL